MKKILSALLTSAVINVLGMLINYNWYLATGYLLLAKDWGGGDCRVWTGFGLYLIHFYPMLGPGESYDPVSPKLELYLPGLLKSFLAIALIAYVLIWIVAMIRKRKKERI